MPRSMNMGTTMGARADHLAEAEPMNRSKMQDTSTTMISSSGVGRASSRKEAAALTARIGPRPDQLNMATKWAAKKARTIKGASWLIPSRIIRTKSWWLLIEPEPAPKAAPAMKKVRAKKATSERYRGLKRCSGSASASTNGEPGRKVTAAQTAIMARMVRPAQARPRFSAA